ncbi:DUF3387 domain-containing protein [Trichococcus sp. K1Tr]|nr:type I restriction enzyme endonuclease domain-containing protein [Trichococcus sp. K1Tr]MDB6352431.1 DUF3387 domain-containing protein [Trichococcus sp. K1Tr]
MNYIKNCITSPFAKEYSEMLKNFIDKYNKRSIQTSKVIEELFEIAKRT